MVKEFKQLFFQNKGIRLVLKKIGWYILIIDNPLMQRTMSAKKIMKVI